MSVKVCCDWCNNPLDINLNCATDAIILYRTKNVNTRHIFPHLCKDCAFKIDEVVRLAKDEWIKQIDISSRNAAINSARREALGTKG